MEPGPRAAQPQPADGQPKQREFRPDIQGLRALAVGMVVFYHLYPSLMTGGFAGRGHHLTSTHALTAAPYLETRLLRVSKTLAEA